ncbi:MAG: tyrosinase family protein [Chloroflexota bacterium]|nr:tyrosinase family protein [Chloroflexota bacterium]
MTEAERTPVTRHSRRVLLTSAAGMLGAALPLAQGDSAQGAPAATTLHVTRRDVASLDANGPEIAALRRGVAVMQQLSLDDPADPRGWRFQANIHGAPPEEGSNPAWRQCQHGSFFFLPWHRMYLYWFERILRWAAEDPTLTLPYWNYFIPANRVLPEPFRLPADASNALYMEDRDPIVNAGVPPWSAFSAFFDHRRAFATTRFFHEDPLDVSFGGAWAMRPVHSGAAAQNTGLLESTPHGQIHVMIGGRIEDAAGAVHTAPMGDTRRAARDPIFWLHHCNIDRLWERWLDQGDGRANPLDDATWLDTAFSFFDETGRAVQMTARDILNPYALGYGYDDDPLPSGGGSGDAPRAGVAPPDDGDTSAAAPQATAPPSVTAPGEGSRSSRASRRSLLGASRAGSVIELSGSLVTVPIQRDASAAQPGASGATSERIVLTIEGLRGLGIPGVTWQVLLHRDLPPGTEPPSATQVGVLSLFGLQPDDAMAHHSAPSANQSFDVTKLALTAMNDPAQHGRFAVSFVPFLFGSAPVPLGLRATIDRVRLSVG